MKQRTIEDLHNKNYGHRKFANICDLLISKGYQITDIKEYNEQFKFKVNNHLFWYRKEWKSSAKDFVQYLINILDTEERLKQHNKIWRF